MNQLVSFFGVAAAKSGTTWLHSCLAEHPQIFMPITKELDFFSENFTTGLDSYKRNFQAAQESQLKGEFSPSYGPHPLAAQRLHGYNSNAKLIWMFREPVDRAYSHYCMACRTQQQVLPLRDILDKNSDFVRYGEYSSQVKRFLEFFPMEQHLFIDYQSLKSPETAQRLLRTVFNFLGVDSRFKPSLLNRKLNTRKPLSRFPRAFDFAKSLALKAATKSKSFEKALQMFRTSSAMAAIHKVNSAPVEFEAIDSEFRLLLEKHYKPFNDELRELSNGAINF